MHATVGEQQDSLCIERLGKDLGKQEGLGEGECRVDPVEREGMLSREEHEPASCAASAARSCVGLLFREHLESSIHAFEALLQLSSVPEDVGAAGRDTRAAGCVAARRVSKSSIARS